MNNCIYRLIGENREILYIGKASNLGHRLSSHTHLPKECYKKTKLIEYHSFNTKGDMDLAEIYYISKYKPVYNDVSKYDISISIKEFDELRFETYVGMKLSKKEKSVMRDLELYIKYNSFGNYTLYNGKKCYRVHNIFFKNKVEELSQKGIHTEFDGYEKYMKFGVEYELVTHLVYSYEDNHSFYVCYEKEIEHSKIDILDKFIQSCNHKDIIEKEQKGIIYTICNKCSRVISSNVL